MSQIISTYSMWNSFRNCRKACEWRYVKELVSVTRDQRLSFGSLVHECLEKWHRDRNIDTVLGHIDKAYVNRASDESMKADWHLARAMMAGYADSYPYEDFDVISLETPFEGSIINPETGSPSRSFIIAGKVDGIVRMRSTGEYYLIEHKTAAQLDGSYLEKLWTDLQVAVYSHYIAQTLGIRLSGVIYNVLVKAKLQQGKGETESEFITRRSELLAKSKSGKSTAQRRMPESDDAFAERLAAKYREPGMFHREMLYVSTDQFDSMKADLWEFTQQFLDCRRRGVFYRNTAYCFHYHRPCAYYALCSSGGNPNVIANFYEIKPPHEELRTDDVIESDKEVF